jgi:branched-chain amino acid transport system permease protein
MAIAAACIGDCADDDLSSAEFAVALGGWSPPSQWISLRPVDCRTSYGSTLFLVSAGLTLIFGVTRVVNFAHGSLYMLGAYIAYTITTQWTPSLFSFFGGLLLAALAVAAVGAVIEIVLLRRIYSSPEIFQLLATFGVVLIVQDVALAIWGPSELFAPRAPGLKGSVEIAGAFVPQYSILVMIVGPAVYALLWWVINRTRLGIWVRAASGSRDRRCPRS